MYFKLAVFLLLTWNYSRVPAYFLPLATLSSSSTSPSSEQKNTTKHPATLFPFANLHDPPKRHLLHFVSGQPIHTAEVNGILPAKQAIRLRPPNGPSLIGWSMTSSFLTVVQKVKKYQYTPKNRCCFENRLADKPLETTGSLMSSFRHHQILCVRRFGGRALQKVFGIVFLQRNTHHPSIWTCF